jgi:enolase
MMSFAGTTVSGVKHPDSRDGAALYLSDTVQYGPVGSAGVSSGALTGTCEAGGSNDRRSNLGQRPPGVFHEICDLAAKLDGEPQYAVVDVTMIELGTLNPVRLGANAFAGTLMMLAQTHASSTGQPEVKMLVAHNAGCAVPFRSNLPGPSRRIVVEPIEVPAQPVQVPETTPAEPAGHPEDEPVPAR